MVMRAAIQSCSLEMPVARCPSSCTLDLADIYSSGYAAVPLAFMPSSRVLFDILPPAKNWRRAAVLCNICTTASTVNTAAAPLFLRRLLFSSPLCASSVSLA